MVLPNAPMGNTLSLELRDDDLYIKKQFAFMYCIVEIVLLN